MKLIAVLALILHAQYLLVSGAPERRPLNGHEVVRTFPSTVEQVKLLQDLEGTFDFWSQPRLNGPTDIRFTPANKVAMRNLLAEKGIRHEILIQNIQDVVDKEERSQVRSTNAMDWTSYRGVDEIQSWLTDLAAEHKDIAELIDIGSSTEGRKMLVIRIGYPSSDGSVKKAYFADAGIHAREWISSAICTYFINELLTNRDQYEDLLRGIDFYFLPNANPDGYEYSRDKNGDRLWRKTRSNYNSIWGCRGADPNRNFDHHFGGSGTSTDKCSEIYKGPNAFSEPETQAISQFILNRKSADWRVYNALHSYSQMVLTPWGYTYDLPEDYKDLKNLGDQAAAALTAVHKTKYEVGSVTELLSPGAGGSDDWAKGSGAFKYAYTLEVRDTGRYGFILPAEQIIPTAEETWQAVLVFANFVKNSS